MNRRTATLAEPTRTPRRSAAAVLAAVAGLALVLAGCPFGTEEEPRDTGPIGIDAADGGGGDAGGFDVVDPGPDAGSDAASDAASDARGDSEPGPDGGDDVRVDIGIDAGTGECSADECGPAPGMPNWLCDDGSVGGPVCERGADGVCGWRIHDCEPFACDPDECGPAPGAPNYVCEDGSVGGPVCEQTAPGECGWLINDCEPFTCDPDDCGPGLGMPNWECPDGSLGGPSCDMVDDGTCEWVVHECAERGCYSHEDCEVGELCSAEDLCLPDPSCPACDVCYGYCEPIACPEVWSPVCGVDGVTYSNACFARAAHVEVAYEGECEAPPECRSNEDCGGDEICYPPTDECQEPCVIACIDYDPVCGTDGTAYPCGEASAHCAGVEVAYEGECAERCELDAHCDLWELCIDGICSPAACPDVWRPVCGVDGDTYGNTCEARAAHVEVAYEGPCDDDRECRSNGDCAGDEICYPPTGECRPTCDIACFRYDPVCGTDGVTYGCGDEDAWCHGAEVAYEGECADTAECSADECGPAPMLPDVLCPDGSTAGAVCERGEEGACGWFVTECPETIGCHGDDACPDDMECNAGRVCLPDPDCPVCAVCYGWCVMR